MTQPRMTLPGVTYLLSRRTLRRHLLLRPDRSITQLILYALAVSAYRFGIQVHAFCAMSTHLHLVVTDVHGVLPDFLRSFHRLVALGTKVLRKWEGPVWDTERTSSVRLCTREAVVQKIAYTLANPVAAGLVHHARDWPGAKVDVDHIGRGMLRVARPDVYFDPTNPQWPEEATLPIGLPPSVDDADLFRREVAAELHRQEATARADVIASGRRFLGADGACRVCPEERATSFEPLRKLNPTFAVGRGSGAEAYRRAAATVVAFRAAYRKAIDQWRAGVRNVVFPLGTWWMRVFHGVVTAKEVELVAV